MSSASGQAVPGVRGLLDKLLLPMVDIEFSPRVLLLATTHVYSVYTSSMVHTHKSRTPGYHGDCILYDGA